MIIAFYNFAVYRFMINKSKKILWTIIYFIATVLA